MLGWYTTRHKYLVDVKGEEILSPYIKCYDIFRCKNVASLLLSCLYLDVTNYYAYHPHLVTFQQRTERMRKKDIDQSILS